LPGEAAHYTAPPALVNPFRHRFPGPPRRDAKGAARPVVPLMRRRILHPNRPSSTPQGNKFPPVARLCAGDARPRSFRDGSDDRYAGVPALADAEDMHAAPLELQIPVFDALAVDPHGPLAEHPQGFGRGTGQPRVTQQMG